MGGTITRYQPVQSDIVPVPTATVSSSSSTSSLSSVDLSSSSSSTRRSSFPPPVSRHCQTCQGALHPAYVCSRCAGVYCGRCFYIVSIAHYRSFVIDFCQKYTLIVPLLPSRLLVYRSVCDSCLPDIEQEKQFQRIHLPLLLHSAPSPSSRSLSFLSNISLNKSLTVLYGTPLLFIRTFVVPGITPIVRSVWVYIDIPTRSLHYRSIQLQNQEPLDKGEIMIDEIAGIQLGNAVLNVINNVPSAWLTSSSSSTASTSSPIQPDYLLRLVNARGHTLLLLNCTSKLQFQSWNEALTALVNVSKLKYSQIFPSRANKRTSNDDTTLTTVTIRDTVHTIPPSANTTSSSTNATLPSNGDGKTERERRQAEREAFRTRIGQVGMQNTAKIRMEKQQQPTQQPQIAPHPGSSTATVLKNNSSSSSSASSTRTTTPNSTPPFGSLPSSLRTIISNVTKPPPSALDILQQDNQRNRSNSSVNSFTRMPVGTSSSSSSSTGSSSSKTLLANNLSTTKREFSVRLQSFQSGLGSIVRKATNAGGGTGSSSSSLSTTK